MWKRNKKYQHQSDEQLMQALVKGHKKAFSELYNRYAQKMKNYFFHLLWEEGLANDLTQDLFLKVLEKASYFNPEYRFSTWLYTLASNMSKNYFRDKKPNYPLEDAEQISSSATSKLENLDRIQFNKDLQQVLQKLKPSHQQCFVLRFQEELSIQEIAKIMEIPEGTVKSRLYYSLRRMAAELHYYKNSI